MITKEQFLAGKHFTIGVSNSKGDSTYRLENVADSNSQFISKQIRSEKDGRVLLDDHHANISSISEEGFTAYSNVLTLIVNRVVNFSQLYLIEENS